MVEVEGSEGKTERVSTAEGAAHVSLHGVAQPSSAASASHAHAVERRLHDVVQGNSVGSSSAPQPVGGVAAPAAHRQAEGTESVPIM